MTQNGQGNEPHLPAVPPAREGVVLPPSGPRPGEPAHGGSWAPDPQGAPAAGQPWGQPWGPDSEAVAPQPPQGQAWGEPGGAQPYPGAAGDPNRRDDGAPGLPPGGPYPSQPGVLPPAAPPPPPGPPPGQMPPYGAQPQSSDADATRMLPPQQPHASPFDGPGPRGGSAGAGAGSWPQPGPDSEATRFMPPASGAPGAPLPPETPSEQAAERTTFLGRHAPHPGGPGGGGADADATQVMGVRVPHPPQAGGDADRTRHMPPAAGGEPPRPAAAPFGIRPGMPGDRPPPAEFDGLFRSDAAPETDRTRHMPPAAGPHPPYGPQAAGPRAYEPQGRAGRRNAAPRRGLSTAAIIGIVVAACAVVGLAAGAALSSGEETADGKQPAAGSGRDEPSKGPDPAVRQAEALDVLLADSNNSRSEVIRAVASIKTCTNLDTAATDLRDAANQRKSLVTRLAKTEIDRLPAHSELARSLNAAWKASASADLHYAAWADQVAGKKGCHKGKARSTAHTAAGNRASGDATVAKKQAARLWNAIARDHGLTERQYGQL